MEVYSTLRKLKSSLSEVTKVEENKILRVNLKDDLSEHVPQFPADSWPKNHS